MQRRRCVAVNRRLDDGIHVRIKDDDARQPLRIGVLVKLFVRYHPCFRDAGGKLRRFVQQADFALGAFVRHGFKYCSSRATAKSSVASIAFQTLRVSCHVNTTKDVTSITRYSVSGIQSMLMKPRRL